MLQDSMTASLKQNNGDIQWTLMFITADYFSLFPLLLPISHYLQLHLLITSTYCICHHLTPYLNSLRSTSKDISNSGTLSSGFLLFSVPWTFHASLHIIDPSILEKMYFSNFLSAFPLNVTGSQRIQLHRGLLVLLNITCYCLFPKCYDFFFFIYDLKITVASINISQAIKCISNISITSMQAHRAKKHHSSICIFLRRSTKEEHSESTYHVVFCFI